VRQFNLPRNHFLVWINGLEDSTSKQFPFFGRIRGADQSLLLHEPPIVFAFTSVGFRKSGIPYSGNLARPAIAGRARTLLCPRLVGRSGGGRRMLGMLKRHEVEILLKARSLQAKWPFWREFPYVRQPHCGRSPVVMSMTLLSERSGGSADPASLRISGNCCKDSGRKTRPAFPWRSFAGFGSGLPGWQDRLIRSGGFCSSERDKATDSFRRLPGEFSQHDFGQVDVAFLDGRSVVSTSSLLV